MNEDRARSEQDEVLGVTLKRTDRPLTILGITPWRELYSMGKGTGATAFMRSPVALAAAGHRVHIVQPCAGGNEGVESYAGVQFHRHRAPQAQSNPQRALPVRLTSRAWRYGWFTLTASRRALNLAREISPDVIVGYDVMSAPAARRVADRTGLPAVGRYYGNTSSLALHRRLSWWGAFTERIGFRVPMEAMILTNDGSDALEVLRRLKVDLSPVHYLRNGIPACFAPGPRDQTIRDRLALPADAFVMMTVTRFHSEKRLDRALRVLAEVRPIVPGACLVMLGEGPERRALESLARKLGVEDAVRMPGPIRNDELPPWYRQADIVLSLLDRTNAANPVFEAMACECCVVALAVGTTSEVVRDGETGVLVPPDRVDEIHRRVAALHADPARRRELGERARRHVLRLCGSVEERMEREVAIIEEVARNRCVVPGNLAARQESPRTE